MTLFAAWSEIVADGAPHFPQPRTFRRAARQALGSLVCVGRRCLSRIIWTQGRPHRSWSSEYFLHSRCRWEPQSLFAGVWRRALPYCPGRLVGVAIDDTRLRKTGRAIPQARYHRDPLSPPFHVNLMRGLRFLQASLLLPLHRRGNVSCRALPVRFEEAAPLKKPSRKAGAEAWQEYKRMSKRHNLSQRLVQMMASLRQALDEAGGRAKLLVLALDGSFCNRTCFRAARHRTELIARARKDARLCWRAASPSRRFYALSSFTPEQVRQDESYLWKPTQIFYGGKRRRIRYQEVTQIYWRRGAGRIPLRLFVVAPTPYRKRKSSKLYYRQPAYLLSTDLRHSAPQLLQIYFDRWQIEVNANCFFVNRFGPGCQLDPVSFPISFRHMTSDGCSNLPANSTDRLSGRLCTERYCYSFTAQDCGSERRFVFASAMCTRVRELFSSKPSKGGLDGCHLTVPWPEN